MNNAIITLKVGNWNMDILSNEKIDIRRFNIDLASNMNKGSSVNFQSHTFQFLPLTFLFYVMEQGNTIQQA